MVRKTTSIYGQRLDTPGSRGGGERPALLSGDMARDVICYGTIYGVASGVNEESVYGP